MQPELLQSEELEDEEEKEELSPEEASSEEVEKVIASLDVVCPHCKRITPSKQMVPTTASLDLSCSYCAHRWMARGGRPRRLRNRLVGRKYTGIEDYRRYNKYWWAKLEEQEKERLSYQGRWWNKPTATNEEGC
jgi:DNA-directed RNA polymerase subunit RPC12/RpoP